MTEPTDPTVQTRCGYVALLGAPNAGKSTLLNALVGSKVAIVTPKVQTTRTRIIGIAMAGAAQLIFVDTPGIFAPKRTLEKAMVAAAWTGAADADLIAVLVDARRPSGVPDDDTQRIVEGLSEAGRSAVLVLNKIDLVPRESLLALANSMTAREGLFTEVFMISALKGDGLSDLREHFANSVRPGPWLYPEDQAADVPMKYLAAEITREKLFLTLHQELPYALTVETEAWEEYKDGSARIDQVVYVSRKGHKGIVLGKGGSQIKGVGEAARKELEVLLDRRIHLFLHVKVRENWTQEPARYREMGLDFPGLD